MATDYIKQVEEVGETVNSSYGKGEVKKLISYMTGRDLIANDEELNLYAKLKMLTSQRAYEIDKNQLNTDEEVMSNRIALNHTVFLINSLLNYNLDSGTSKKAKYKRTLEGMNIEVDINSSGLHLIVRQHGKVELDRRIGGRDIHTYVDWLKVREDVHTLDTGLLQLIDSTLGVVFECRVEVDKEDYNELVDKIEMEFHNDGLETFEIIGDPNNFFPKQEGKELLRLSNVYYNHNILDYKQAIAIVNDALKEQGYPK
ncbi:hypothetical protein P4493_05905 [Bacillus thuringiensis]|uniref:Uncharacterized protein n=3 Tax=Bacillus thuringiensis TaxID=1428 RepID=A0A0B5NKH9_BACTU|nr:MULTISPECIES: hypothetical protein [Bacillus]EAO55634.1 hypothetical protein RBTH_06770 [Bacillus thuringiensis serovar israelensis ATCC 35646]MEC2533097.1 hypothetical protein [Bacillus cereus]MED1153923.1 hypothetical protein [Bacillus paranthracis]OUB09236.1 hypothetical protein BK708_32390 [Bacillus thuringiensis serovar yunnanensis]AFQ29795.1 hypothetical protein BTF1_28472 [Bacillus thuringiensis HD-789]